MVSFFWYFYDYLWGFVRIRVLGERFVGQCWFVGVEVLFLEESDVFFLEMLVQEKEEKKFIVCFLEFLGKQEGEICVCFLFKIFESSVCLKGL